MEPQQSLNKTLAILESLPTQSPKASALPQSSPAAPFKQRPITPPKTKWQKKWLALNCHCPELFVLCDAVEKFCGRWYRNDRRESVLVLMGESGCGKTHTAKAIGNFSRAMAFHALESQKVWDHVPSSWFAFWPEIAEEFKQKNFSAAEMMRSEDLLIIDDIGAEDDPFKQATNMLCQVLTRREEKFTLITTNIQTKSWSDKFDTRIADRLFRNSVIVDLFGVPSFSEL